MATTKQMHPIKDEENKTLEQQGQQNVQTAAPVSTPTTGVPAQSNAPTQPTAPKQQAFSKVTDYLRANQQRGQALAGQQVQQVKQQQADLTGAFQKAQQQTQQAIQAQQQRVESEGQQARQLIADVGANKITQEQLTPEQTALYKRYTTGQTLEKIDPSQYFSNVQQLLQKQRQAGAQQQFAQTNRAGGLDAALLAKESPVLGQQQKALQQAQQQAQTATIQAPNITEAAQQSAAARYAQEQAKLKEETQAQLTKMTTDIETSAKNEYEKQRQAIAEAIYNRDINKIKSLGLDQATEDLAIKQAGDQLYGVVEDRNIPREQLIEAIKQYYKEDTDQGDTSFKVGTVGDGLGGLVQRYASDQDLQRLATLQKLVDQNTLGQLSNIDAQTALTSGPGSQMLGGAKALQDIIDKTSTDYLDQVKTKMLPVYKTNIKQTVNDINENFAPTPGSALIDRDNTEGSFEKFILKGVNSNPYVFLRPENIFRDGVVSKENGDKMIEALQLKKKMQSLEQNLVNLTKDNPMFLFSLQRGRTRSVPDDITKVYQELNSVKKMYEENPMKNNPKTMQYEAIVNKAEQYKNNIWKGLNQSDIRK